MRVTTASHARSSSLGYTNRNSKSHHPRKIPPAIIDHALTLHRDRKETSGYPLIGDCGSLHAPILSEKTGGRITLLPHLAHYPENRSTVQRDRQVCRSVDRHPSRGHLQGQRCRLDSQLSFHTGGPRRSSSREAAAAPGAVPKQLDASESSTTVDQREAGQKAHGRSNEVLQEQSMKPSICSSVDNSAAVRPVPDIASLIRATIARRAWGKQREGLQSKRECVYKGRARPRNAAVDARPRPPRSADTRASG